MSPDHDVLAREPLGFRGEIPYFSGHSDYTANYEQISRDHLETFRKAGTNPFIEEDLWVDFERSTIELIEKYAPPSGTILDAGVGLGRLLSHFPQLRRFGADISWGYLEVARSNGIDVCYSLIEDLPYRKELFDIVVCTDVLEHVLDLNACCAKLLAVLRPAGTLIIRVPYREDLRPYLAPGYPYKYVHLRNFDEFSLRLHFERVFNCRTLEITTAGYQPSRSRLKYTVPIPLGGAILSRLLSGMGKRQSSPLYGRLVQLLYHPIVINVALRKH